mmetsp:Transcript_13201/g.12818  ORF Transcript_13201/g.12818 Transcript_13201/m.12818 type:complete len:105 (+) Transcript_13201:813-1127(+)
MPPYVIACPCVWRMMRGPTTLRCLHNLLLISVVVGWCIVSTVANGTVSSNHPHLGSLLVWSGMPLLFVCLSGTALTRKVTAPPSDEKTLPWILPAVCPCYLPAP